MAILKPVTTLMSLGVALAGCSALPEVQQSDAVRHSIGWITRQFMACEDSACPQPTKKTLAVVDVPRKSAPVIDATPPVREITSEEVIERTIQFEFGKALPTPAGLKATLALLPLARTAIRIDVIGRTDDVGTKAYNDKLARNRADHVRDWLARQGVTAAINVRAEGLCCYRDIAATEVARRRNRRVEVRLVHLLTRGGAVINSKGVQ